MRLSISYLNLMIYAIDYYKKDNVAVVYAIMPLPTPYFKELP